MILKIIVSNNSSSDNTDEAVNNFKVNNQDLHLKYYSQEKNLGLEQNALFVLRKASASFIMFLGDDDYVDENYLKVSINYLKENKSTHCIIPNFIPVDIHGKQLNAGRDDHLLNKVYKKGFKNCLINSWRGHQLSGLILKTENLYDSYKKYNIQNIYPFIFFVSFCCLNGDTYHLTQLPVKVTQPGQQNKDWNYGDDGLINEIFDNYIKLPLNQIKITLLQLYILRKQQFRLFNYLNKGNVKFKVAFKNIWFSEKSTFLFKILFPLEVLLLRFYSFLKTLTTK